MGQINKCNGKATCDIDFLHMCLSRLSISISSGHILRVCMLAVAKNFLWSIVHVNWNCLVWMPLNHGRFNCNHAKQCEVVQGMASYNHQQVPWWFGLQNVSYWSLTKLISYEFKFFAGWNSSYWESIGQQFLFGVCTTWRPWCREWRVTPSPWQTHMWAFTYNIRKWISTVRLVFS